MNRKRNGRGLVALAGLFAMTAAASWAQPGLPNPVSPEPPGQEVAACVHLFTPDDGEILLDIGKPLEGKAIALTTGHTGRKDKGKGVILARVAAGPEWKPMAFTFTPSADGEVQVNLRGAYWRPDSNAAQREVYVYVDDLEILLDGKKLSINGDMEDGRSMPTGWRRINDQAEYIVDPDLAHSGRRCARVSWNARCYIVLNVKGGKTYTARCWFRYDPETSGLKMDGAFRMK